MSGKRSGLPFREQSEPARAPPSASRDPCSGRRRSHGCRTPCARPPPLPRMRPPALRHLLRRLLRLRRQLRLRRLLRLRRRATGCCRARAAACSAELGLSPAKRAMYRASKPALVTEQPRAVCGATESSNTRSPALSVSSTDVGASDHRRRPRLMTRCHSSCTTADSALALTTRPVNFHACAAIAGRSRYAGAELTERPAREDRRLEPLRRPERGARGRAVGVVAEKPDLHDRLGESWRAEAVALWPARSNAGSNINMVVSLSCRTVGPVDAGLQPDHLCRPRAAPARSRPRRSSLPRAVRTRRPSAARCSSRRSAPPARPPPQRAIAAWLPPVAARGLLHDPGVIARTPSRSTSRSTRWSLTAGSSSACRSLCGSTASPSRNASTTA